jgi:hypothetical protein
MFAKKLATAAAIALAVGTACKDGPDNLPLDFDTSAVAARGTRVIPLPAPADTSATASAYFNTATLAYMFSVTVAPAGTIDSIALYQVAAGDVLPPSATAILCAGTAACASTSGTATVMPPATRATIKTSIRAYGTQLVFFTTTAQKAAGGAMRGTMYPTPPD